MKQKIRVALYPIFADTLPVARYLLKYRSNIEVVELISPLGSCVCGKDASTLDNQESLGKCINSCFDTNPDSWDELWLLQHETLGLTEESTFRSIYEPMVKIANGKNKKVCMCPSVMDSTVKVDTEYETEQQNRGVIKKFGSIKPIKTFSIFIGGVIAEANAFEVFLNLYGELEKRVRVAAFSSSPNASTCNAFGLHDLLYHTSYTEEQKVFAIDRRIAHISKERKADIILIQLDEALMPFSDTLTSGFGIIPYIVSQTIEPDFCICCLPFGYDNPSFLQEFDHGLESKFGILTDQWHLSTVMLDFTTMTSVRDAGAIHLPMYMVKNEIKIARNKGLCVCNAMIPENLDELVSIILSSYHESQRITSIL